MSRTDPHAGTFKTGDVARLTEIPYRTIDHWARTGFIRPSAAAAKGTGSDRLYTCRDITLLRIATFLRGKGVAFSAVVPAIEVLRKEPVIDGGWLVMAGDVNRLVHNPGEAIKLMRSVYPAPAFGILLNITQIIQELETKIRE